jgi:hypothetical protein
MMKIVGLISASLFVFNQTALIASTPGSGPADNAPSQGHPAAATPAFAASYGKLPLSFEANQGQSDRQVKFLSRGSGYSLFLTDSAAVLALSKGTAPSKRGFDRAGIARQQPGPSARAAKTDVVRMELAGASRGLRVTGADQVPGTANYFIGKDPANWHPDVPTYAKVKYAGVYPGIDLVYYGNQRQLEYDFVIAPGADPKHVRLHFAGAKKLQLNAHGDLEVKATDGEIAFRKPAVYQVVEGRRRSVPGRFTLHTRNRVGFSVGGYDKTSPLTIDPILEYSTYLGGSGDDFASAIAVDSAGNAYVTGEASSTDFPVTTGAYQTVNPNAGNGCAFIAKLNSAGTSLVYATYLGGSTAYAEGSSIAVDSIGDAYVTGGTQASDFPTTASAVQPKYPGTISTIGTTRSGTTTSFITKLNPAGNGLVYSTYLGGSGATTNSGAGDYGTSIALDSSGDAFVAGYTYSINFPTTHGAFRTTNGAAANSATNAFVAKLNPAGTGLVYSTYLGGSGGNEGQGDLASGVAIDAGGNAYVTGSAYSSNFPVTSGALQTVNHAAANPENSAYSASAYVTKLNPAGTALVYSTYLGGSGDFNVGQGIAVDHGGNAYLTGSTDSSDFPMTSGAFQTTNKSGQYYNSVLYYGSVSFVTKLNPAGTALVYSTYLGGTGGDYGNSIAVDSNGNAYVTGDSYSTDFPVTSDAFQRVNNGAIPQLDDDNAFVTELNSTGSALVYSTYLGGTSEDSDYGQGIALDSAGNVYVTGDTGSTDFPVTNGAFRVVNNSQETGFVAKFSIGAASGLTPSAVSLSSNPSPANLGAKVTFIAQVAPATGSGTPTGTVSFSAGGGAPASVPLNSSGQASYSTSALPIGPQTVVATYSGDTIFAASNSELSEFNFGPPAFIVAFPSGQTTQLGSVFQYPLNVYVEDAVYDSLPGLTVEYSGTDLDFNPSSATTDIFGSASVAAVPTAIGSLTATATVSGTSLQATFGLTATAPFGLQFMPVTPCRIADTRNPTGQFGGPEPKAGSTTTFNIPQSPCSIPSTAVAYSLNVTVVPNGPLGYLTLWPTGQAQPLVSTLNSDGRVKANAAIVPAGVYGGVSVYVTNPTQVILDIDGYFVPAGTTSALAFYPVAPCRLVDTRTPNGPLGGPSLAASGSRAFPVQSSNCNLPPTAQAYSLNVTAVPHTKLGYLTIWPMGEDQPLASTLNASTGAVTANAAIVPAGGGGDVSVFADDAADVILDVNGYFAPPAAGGLSLYTAAPCRVIDTRPAAFTRTLAINVQASTCAPPATAEAYVLNATVVPDGALGYLTLWPAGASQPLASTLNAADKAITSNVAIVPTTNGEVNAFADGTTNLILDLSGYFAP